MRLRRKVRHAVFFASTSGREPVREWLQAMEPGDRKAIGLDVAKLEFGASLHPPLCKKVGGGLWEVRTRLPRRRIARVFFLLEGTTIVLLHGFVKKARKAPDKELKLARQRQSLWEDDDAQEEEPAPR